MNVQGKKGEVEIGRHEVVTSELEDYTADVVGPEIVVFKVREEPRKGGME